ERGAPGRDPRPGRPGRDRHLRDAEGAGGQLRTNVSRPVALLSDFGYSDAYAGVMKAVVLSRCRDAVLFDLTHGVPPQDVLAGALHLAAAVQYCPPDTVFLAVVDPGVGGERRPLCLRAGGRLFVGPDNGLLWPA